MTFANAVLNTSKDKNLFFNVLRITITTTHDHCWREVVSSLAICVPLISTTVHRSMHRAL